MYFKNLGEENELLTHCFISKHYKTSHINVHNHFRNYYYNIFDAGEDFQLMDEFPEISIGNHSQDFIESATINDYIQIFDKYKINSSDIILHPGTDFYSVRALLAIIENIEPENRPSLRFRFFDVMENATQFYSKPFEILIDSLKALIKLYSSSTSSIKIGSETSVYAEILSEKLNYYVHWSPYPDLRKSEFDLENTNTNFGRKYFFFPGSGREDKGFHHIEEIASIALHDIELCHYNFICQALPPKIYKHKMELCNRIASLPNVQMLPHAITSDELNYHYSNSLAVILPYDRATYKLRGSACIMEASSFRVPVVTFTDLAFSDIVSMFRLGALCNDVNSIVYALKKIISKDLMTNNIIKKNKSINFSNICKQSNIFLVS
jgi:hypothetical protein